MIDKKPLLKFRHYSAPTEYSDLLNTLKIKWDSICGSSYCFGDLNEEDEVDDDIPNLIALPFQANVFNLPSMKKIVPRIEKGVNCSQYLNPKMYELIFFAEPENPTEWHGFVALSHSESIKDNAYLLDLQLEIVFVKPSSRGNNLSEIMSYEIGRRIGEQLLNEEVINSKTKTADIMVNGQGINNQGKKAIERLYEGLCFCLEEIDFDDHYLLCDIEEDDDY